MCGLRKRTRLETKCTVASLGHEDIRGLSWDWGLKSEGKVSGQHARVGVVIGAVGVSPPESPTFTPAVQ